MVLRGNSNIKQLHFRLQLFRSPHDHLIHLLLIGTLLLLEKQISFILLLEFTFIYALTGSIF